MGDNVEVERHDNFEKKFDPSLKEMSINSHNEGTFKSSNSLSHYDIVDSENGDKLSTERSLSESSIEITHPTSGDPVINESFSITDEAIDSFNSFSELLPKDHPNEISTSQECRQKQECMDANAENGVKKTSCLSLEDNFEKKVDPLLKEMDINSHNQGTIKSSNSLSHDDIVDSESGDKLSTERSLSESGIEITHPTSGDQVINDSFSITDEAIDSFNSSSELLPKDLPNEISPSSEELHQKQEYVGVNTENGVVKTIEFAEEETSCLSSEGNGLEGSDTESDFEDNVPLDGDEFSHRSAIAMKLKLRKENPILPETVTVLKTPEGGKVYLVGTAHFSLSSQEDVAVTIQETMPDVVMVELCKSRVNILSLDEETVLEESKNMNFEKMHAAIKQNGLIQGIMYLLLLSMSAHLTKQLGMAPGSEFRKAFTEAKRIPGCLVHLGDRPIQITLQRALASLSWWQKLRLAWYMLTSKEPISKEEVEKCKKKDLLEEMLAEMTGEFPALSHVFVKERDIYLAYSLKLAASPAHSLSAPTVVVGVVGIGHVPGIVENWDKVTEYDILPILKVPESSLTTKVLRHTFRISLLGLTVWGCYRFLLPTSITEVISPQRPVEWISSFFSR